MESVLIYNDVLQMMENLNMEAPPPASKIIVSNAMTQQVLIKMCKSKKRRIRNKWLKNSKNYRTVPRTDILVGPGFIVAHPSVVSTLKKEIASQKGLPEWALPSLMGAPSWSPCNQIGGVV